MTMSGRTTLPKNRIVFQSVRLNRSILFGGHRSFNIINKRIHNPSKGEARGGLCVPLG